MSSSHWLQWTVVYPRHGLWRYITQICCYIIANFTASVFFPSIFFSFKLCISTVPYNCTIKMIKVLRLRRREEVYVQGVFLCPWVPTAVYSKWLIMTTYLTALTSTLFTDQRLYFLFSLSPSFCAYFLPHSWLITSLILEELSPSF